MSRPLCALALIACAEPETRDPTRDQVAGYRAQLNQLELFAAQYDRAMEHATPATCIGIHRTYDRSLRDLVDRMDELDGALDTAIAEHGGAAYADVACTTSALVVELDFHGAVACQELAIADNIAEATRHLIAIGPLVDHAVARTAEIETGLATNAATWTWSLPTSCP